MAVQAPNRPQLNLILVGGGGVLGMVLAHTLSKLNWHKEYSVIMYFALVLLSDNILSILNLNQEVRKRILMPFIIVIGAEWFVYTVRDIYNIMNNDL